MSIPFLFWWGGINFWGNLEDISFKIFPIITTIIDQGVQGPAPKAQCKAQAEQTPPGNKPADLESLAASQPTADQPASGWKGVSLEVEPLLTFCHCFMTSLLFCCPFSQSRGRNEPRPVAPTTEIFPRPCRERWCTPPCGESTGDGCPWKSWQSCLWLRHGRI